jgi:hypothetical protein
MKWIGALVIGCGLVGCRSGGHVRQLSSDAAPLLAKRVPAYDDPDGLSELARELDDTSEQIAVLMSGIAPKHPVKHDRALDAAAAILAHTYGDDPKLVSPALVQWVLWKVGFAGELEWHSYSWAQGTETYRRQALDKNLATQRKGLAEAAEPLFVGVARVHTANRKDAQAIVVATRKLYLQPTPKHVIDVVRLRGRLTPPFDRPVFHIDLDGITTASVAFQPEKDGTFEVVLPRPSTAGVHFVALTDRPPGATDDAWTRKALLPLYFDAAEPSEPSALIPRRNELGSDPQSWPPALLERYNELRARAQLAPYTLDPTITEMAFARARRRASDARSDDGESLGATLVERKIAHGSWQQHLDSFADADIALTFTLFDPAGRDRILRPGATRVGFGFAKAERERYRSVEYFVGEPKL